MPVPSIMIGIETDDGADVLLARHVRDRSHHWNWADGQNQIDARAIFDQLPQLIGDQIPCRSNCRRRW